MTRAVRDRILKDVNGDISDHLRNHIHLTNCIHLKNHMHKHSPILADRALMRELVVLQRSRSLRDPSASPPSWHSPSVADVLLKRAEKDDLVSRRHSVGECGIVSAISPRPTSKAATSQDSIRERRRVKKEESKNGRQLGGDDFVPDSVSGNSESREKSVKMKGEYRQDKGLKTLSDQLKDVPAGNDDAASSHNNGRHVLTGNNAEETGANTRQRNGLNRGRRRKFRGARRGRPSAAIRDADVAQNEMSMASNSKKYATEEGSQEHNGDPNNMYGVPKNGCGIPWNWSRIHHRGKSILDMAGRSFSCGLSESISRKAGGTASRGMDVSNMPVMSEHSSSSTKSDGEALPLLLDASGSQGSVERAAWFHDYSGELGLFADSLLKQETDSDLASEGRSHERRKSRKNERHQSLTQKYMPRTFRDLVGQNLVVQALSNAVVKRRVGLLYLFYGPHGTGKTSCARIFARALNCQSLEHPKPCGFCGSCIAENTGKSRNIREIGPVGNVDFESLVKLNVTSPSSQSQSQYRVFIFDECDTVSSESWSAILKLIDRAPRRVVFVLVCSSIDVLPHVIISRCQKFFFPKLKDADIIYTLQWIATKEDLEIDKDALKLVAARSDGSLRDAEMTLEQLSLLGKRISLGLVQELVGLISDDKLVALLDLALSADTVNTVKNLRDIMESGVEPLALMSQLATVITDILAGSYDFKKERPRRKFFRRDALSKEDMEKLRQALKTLSEAEKQLRVSNDKITWLTAALLQLAPDQQYMLPSSSGDTSLNHSPLILNNSSEREMPRKSNAEMQAGSSVNVHHNDKLKSMDGNEEIERIWLQVLGKIPINGVKEFMYQEGKLISVSYGAAPTAQLLFSSQLTKSKAEKFRLHILQAFESVLGSPVTIEIRCESRKDAGVGPILLPANRDAYNRDASSSGVNMREIIEIEESSREHRDVKSKDYKAELDRRMPSQKISAMLDERNQSLSLVRSKVSLAHVIQQGEGSSQNSGWSKRKAVSIAEKLEQENLKLESRSRRLLCWNPPKVTRRKLSRLKIRTKRPQNLLKYVSCGRCLSTRSPRPR